MPQIDDVQRRQHSEGIVRPARQPRGRRAYFFQHANSSHGLSPLSLAVYRRSFLLLTLLFLSLRPLSHLRQHQLQANFYLPSSLSRFPLPSLSALAGPRVSSEQEAKARCGVIDLLGVRDPGG